MSQDVVISIPIGDIIVGERLRPVDQKAAKRLSLSLGEAGRLINPLIVRPASEGGKYDLVVGAHRLAAAKILGWGKIDAIVLSMSDDEAALLEVDENIYRADLNGYDKMRFMEKRLELFTYSGGKLKRGRHPRKSANMADLGGNRDDANNFYDEVEVKFGIKRRTAERLVRRFRSIPETLKAEIRKKPSAYSDGLLDKIAALEGATPGIINGLIEKHGCTIGQAVKMANAPTEAAKQYAQFEALKSAWARAGEKARAQFREFLMAKKP